MDVKIETERGIEIPREAEVHRTGQDIRIEQRERVMRKKERKIERKKTKKTREIQQVGSRFACTHE